MPSCCAVRLCSEKRGGHKFPRDKERCDKWLKAIRRVNFKPSQYARVCKKHFTEEDYTLPKESYRDNPIPVLKKTAVPSRFSWNNFQSDTMKSPKSKEPDKPQMKSPKSKEPDKPQISARDGVPSAWKFQCRVCRIVKRSNGSDMFVPWSYLGVETTIATHISKVANIEICQVDGWPRFICKECLNRLCQCLAFIDFVRQAEQALKDNQQNEEKPLSNEVTEKTWPKPIQLDKNISAEMMPFDIEIKQEVISDEELEEKGSDYNRQDCEMLLDIKIEPEEITEQTLPIQVTVNGTISQDQFSSLNGCEDYEHEEYLSSTSVKEEPISDDDLSPSDMPLECLLCAKMFHTVSGLKAHVITQHSYKTVKRKAENLPSPESKRPSITKVDRYYVCGICRRSFLTSTDLRVHETCHNKFSCFACNAKFDSFSEVTFHRRQCKVKTKAVKPKTLTDAIRERANTGTEVSSKNKKPQCNACGLSFRDALYLRLHNAEQHPEEDLTEKIKSRTEEKNKEEELQVKVRIEKCREDERKYSKIETELESIFEYAVEKDDKGSEINESVYLGSREQLEKTLGDNGTGNAVGVKVEANETLSEQSQESCEQNDKGTIEFSNSQIDEPKTSMDKIEIEILGVHTVREEFNVETKTDPSDLQENTNFDKDEHMGQVEIEFRRMEENMIEEAPNSQKMDKTDFIKQEVKE